jgi:hypothetical protein
LAAALPLRALASFTDIVPCYDHTAHRLYLVDAQPGGNGLSAWIYAHAEELLPLAYDVALACRNDALLEPLSRADMDWLLALLGRAAQADDRPTTTDQRRRLENREPRTENRNPEPRTPNPEPQTTADDRPSAPAIPAVTKHAADEKHGADQPRTSGGTAAPAPAAPAPSPTSERRPSAEAPPPRRREDGRQPAQPARPAPQAGDRGREQRPAPADDRPYGRPQVSGGGHEQPAAKREPDVDRLYRKPAASDRRRDAPPPTPRPPAPADPRQRELPLGEGRSAPPPPAQQPGRGAPPRADRTQERAPQPEEAPPDPAALIARLRRQREQREGPAQSQRRRSQPDQAGEVEQRFAAGDRIFCLPYGDGTVRESRIEGGRELLTVDFANHGDLTIDPAVNFVRKQEDAPEDREDLL